MKFIPILIASTTILIFLDLIYYLSLINIIKFPSYFVYIFTFILIFIYYFITKKNIHIDKGLLFWVIFFLAINGTYYAMGGAGSREFTLLIPSIIFVFIFLTLSLLYNLDNKDLMITRRSIVLSLLIGTLLLVYDFIQPGFFVSDNIDAYIGGRALATYSNQNVVGAIFILGLILTIDIVPKKFKFLYIIILFIGILVTVSRSNIMIYFIVLSIMALQNKISRISAVWIMSIFVILILWLSLFGLDILRKEFNLEFKQDVTNRLEFFVDTGKRYTDNNSERREVLNSALFMFMDKPILGNGLGSTRFWKYNVGPHNSFAMTWAEFGLIGVLIIPSFLFFTTYKILKSRRKEYRDIGVLFVVYFVFSSFFSHNMLEQVFNLLGAVVIVMLVNKDKLNNEKLHLK